MLRRELHPIGYSPAMALLALSLAGLLLAGCDRKTPEPVSANVQVEAPTTPKESLAPALPAPLPALTRGDLVSAAGQAASAYAQGDAPSSADPLVGRSFAVRLPFGCQGPDPVEATRSEGGGLAAWKWGRDRKTIQLRMTPSDWTASAMLAKSGASDQWEAVEGFWVRWPWLTSESCPAVESDPLQTESLPASPQTVGLAAVFEAGGSRLGRRNGRAYEYTIRPKGDVPLTPPDAGYRMLLEGRIAAFPNGRATNCRSAGPDQRPVCVVAVQLDRVAYEDATGSTLSEWRPG